MASSRTIRPSQFVTTYGAGSLLPIGAFHRIVPSIQGMVHDLGRLPQFSRQDEHGRRDLYKFQINDKKTEKTIEGVLEINGMRDQTGQTKIFKLPSNADLSMPDGQKLYNTDVFPKWSICKKHSTLKKLEYVGRKWINPCSECMREDIRDGGTGIRFIRACPKGHMDDIDWRKEVHGSDSCDGDEYDWTETGNNPEVACKTCGRKTSYNNIRYKSQNNRLACSAYWAETGTRDSHGCSDGGEDTGRLVLKNASNLRIPHVVSSLIIPPFAGKLYKMLAPYDQFIAGLDDDPDIDGMIKKMEKTKSMGISREFISTLSTSPRDEIKKTIRMIKEETESGIRSEHESEEDEFEQLLVASKKGYPRPFTGEPADFVVDKNKVRRFPMAELGADLVVTPIDTLHVTQAQVGYRREVGIRTEEDMKSHMIRPTGDLVPTYYVERSGMHETRWFVGKQIKGEGIFIYADGHGLPDSDNGTHSRWSEINAEQDDRDLARYTDPSFVWWHSFAHGLISDLSIDSGFQSAAISEKTYVKKISSGSTEAGILLYTVQEGGDGTLGGLTGLAPIFDKIMRRSLARLRGCSNDPLCKARKINQNRVSGAACHACLLVSETSCGLQNRFLDRNMLLESM